MSGARGLRWATLPSKGKKPAQRTTLPVNEPSEYDHQVELIRQCWVYRNQYPGLDMINASANGGLRKKGVAGQLKAMGVQDGFPDLELPVARGGYFGLYIELKRPRTGRPSDSQLWWQAKLREQGHRVEICWGWKAAWGTIVDYYSFAPTRVVA